MKSKRIPFLIGAFTANHLSPMIAEIYKSAPANNEHHKPVGYSRSKYTQHVGNKQVLKKLLAKYNR